MNIDTLIATLQEFKAQGVRTVQVSDGFFGYEFNVRTRSAPMYSLATELILRPINNRPDHDGVTRETGVMLQEAN